MRLEGRWKNCGFDMLEQQQSNNYGTLQSGRKLSTAITRPLTIHHKMCFHVEVKWIDFR